MSSFGITHNNIDNPFVIKRYKASKEAYTQMLSNKTLFDMHPKMRSYSYLDPAYRQMAHFTKQGMLTRGGSLLSLFEKEAKIVYDDADNIRHKLYMENNDMRAQIMKADYDSNAQLGKGGHPFPIWIDAETFGYRNILLIDNLEFAPLFVDSVEADANGYWKVMVRLTNSSDAAYINPEDLYIGAGVTQSGSLRGEAAVERGPVAITGMRDSYIEFNTQKTKMGWEYPVTDKALKSMINNQQFYSVTCSSEDMSFGKNSIRRDGHGEKMLNANLVDLKFLAATDKQIDLWLAYGQSAGKYSSPILDKMTNKHFEYGPGFYQWMKYASTDYFNPNSVTIDWFANKLDARWHNNVPVEDRVAHFGTGRLGLKIVRNMARRAELDYTDEHFEVNNEIVNKGHDGKRNGVVINKKQIVGIMLPEFGKIMFHHMPHLDDGQFEKGTYKGYSKRSSEFIGLDIGFGKGTDSNIYIVKDKFESGFGIGVGALTPYGKNFKNSQWLNTEGSANRYKLLRDEAFTIVVKDPQAITWFKPAIK